MRKTIKETVTKEVEISLPYYSRTDSGSHYYCVVSDRDSVHVSNVKGHYSINSADYGSELPFQDDTVECSREEFLAVYSKVSDLIDNLVY